MMENSGNLYRPSPEEGKAFMAKRLWRKTRRILIDVDTQKDLIFCNGSYPHELLGHFRRLIAWARVNKHTVISTALSRRENDTWHDPDTPINCMEGSEGQKKIHYTTLPNRIVFGPENRLDLPRNLLRDYQQIIFEIRTEDPFTHPRADRLLTEMRADEYIAFGMGAEDALKATVLGLLARRKKVFLVIDAVGTRLNDHKKNLVLRQMEAKGAIPVTNDHLTGTSRLLRFPSVRMDDLDAIPAHSRFQS